MKKLVVLSAALMGLLSSCNKQSSIINPDPTNKETIFFTIKAANDGSNQKNTPNVKLQWSNGMANVTFVKFQAKLNHVNYTSQTAVSGPISLFGPIPVINSTFTIPSGSYKQASLSINLANTSSNPSLVLAGNYDDNTSLVPVTLVIDQDLVLNTDPKDITITDNSVTAFTTLQMDTYTDGITAEMFESAEHTIGGNIIISSGMNKPIYDIIVNNLKSN
jgi:hypothetical protein